MVTRPEYLMHLHVRLHVMKALQDLASRIAAGVGAYCVRARYAPDARSELQNEYTEMKRRLGGSERRAFEKLRAEWENKTERRSV